MRSSINCTEPIRRNARLQPDVPAIARSNGTVVTYVELDRTLDALAHRLRDLGLRPGQTALVATLDDHRYPVLLLALARIGVTAAPGGVPPVVADIALSDQPPGSIGHSRVVPLDELWPAGLLDGGAPPPAPMHQDGDAILVLASSSGTTAGNAKLIPLSHQVMAWRVTRRISSPPLAAGTRHCYFVRPQVNYGFFGVLRTLWAGCTVVEPDFRADQAAWLVASRVSHICISPVGLRRMLDVLPAHRVECDLRTMEVGGGVLPMTTYELAQARLPATVIMAYGATEVGQVAVVPFAAVVERPDAVGYVLPGITAQVVDADDHPLPAGHEGILRIRSMGAASQYRGNQAASAGVFRDGWVYPNDRAILDDDGLLRVTGRTDDVVVVEGAKINPQAVEEALLALADLREVAVFGARDGQGVDRICAAIVANGPLDMNDFHARCRARLGARAPVFIMSLRELPRNAMGKVRRTELARLALEAHRPTAPSPGDPGPA